MSLAADVRMLLCREAESLATRIDRLQPFSVSMTMVPAAGVSLSAMAQIEGHLRIGRMRIRTALAGFLGWVRGQGGFDASSEEVQRRFMLLKLHFNLVIAQFDIFADVLVQRSEQGNGVWIAGLDDLAADALMLPGIDVTPPPIICYLDQGQGAAIRRVQTRLPGGDLSPVAVIRVPRERMVGLGIGSSLVHEVGHQAASLFDLIGPMQQALARRQAAASAEEKIAWTCWSRWISEIVADFWAVGRLGLSATLGLIGVVSLPKTFVYRIDLEDPHPFPFIRVLVSAAIGNALFPHSQWNRVTAMWTAMYPATGLTREQEKLIALLRRTLPDLVGVLIKHRARSLGGRTLIQAMRVHERTPERLIQIWTKLREKPNSWNRLPPTLAFAVISQANATGRIDTVTTTRWISRFLTEWAVRSALQTQAATHVDRSPLQTKLKIPLAS
jgi:hypothetical protein